MDSRGQQGRVGTEHAYQQFRIPNGWVGCETSILCKFAFQTMEQMKLHVDGPYSIDNFRINHEYHVTSPQSKSLIWKDKPRKRIPYVPPAIPSETTSSDTYVRSIAHWCLSKSTRMRDCQMMQREEQGSHSSSRVWRSCQPCRGGRRLPRTYCRRGPSRRASDRPSSRNRPRDPRGRLIKWVT